MPTRNPAAAERQRRIQTLVYLSLPCLLSLFAAACHPSDSATAPLPVEAVTAGDTVTRGSAQLVESAATAATAEIPNTCGGTIEALASCAEAKVCDEDISSYLPAASRDALIALERAPGYSAAAFDRYCLRACQSRSSQIDEAAFSREVCAASASAVPTPAAAAKATTMAITFSLHGNLPVDAEGVPLTEITQKFGEPATKRDSRYDCGSAFDEGQIKEYLYPDFLLETDGQKAVIRSLQFGGGNRFTLSDGQSIETLNESQFKKIFGAGVPRYGEAYRTSATADGSLEAAYDFHFDAAGKLKQIDYWIGC